MDNFLTRTAQNRFMSVGFARVNRTVRLGFKSLWLHRLRSLLTVLGIVFGVCSVIAMLAVGEGVRHEALEQIRRLGSNNIIIRSIKPEEERSSAVERSYVLEYGLTYADIRRIRDTIPGVTLVVPGRIIRDFLWNGRWRIDAEVVGTVPWYHEMRLQALSEGRYLNDFDMEDSKNVCVLSREAADRLFPLTPAVGSNLRIGGDYYHVVGVLAREAPVVAPGGGNSSGQNAAQTLARAFIPLTTAKARFGEVLVRRRSGSFEAERVQLHEVTAQVHRQEEVEEIAKIIVDILDKNRKKKDYEIIVPLELLRQSERTKRIFNIVLGSIAAISLIVGGIGIMNIMLASVTERTREIGIRRALGAKRRDIIFQFLVETVILSGSGGLIGVVLGVAIPFFITLFADMTTIVTLWAPMIAFSISGLVGVVFGIYPALRAADMDPVEALRHE